MPHGFLSFDSKGYDVIRSGLFLNLASERDFLLTEARHDKVKVDSCSLLLDTAEVFLSGILDHLSSVCDFTYFLVILIYFYLMIIHESMLDLSKEGGYPFYLTNGF